MISCLHRRQPEQKSENSPYNPCNSAEHRSDPVESHACAAILQGATSGAAALKVGVGRGPAVTV